MKTFNVKINFTLTDVKTRETHNESIGFNGVCSSLENAIAAATLQMVLVRDSSADCCISSFNVAEAKEI